MIITISGKAGSGKSTIAKLLAAKLKLKHHSTGDFMRQMAKEKRISLLELSKEAETDKTIDKELDERQIKLGVQQDNFVIDGRLSAFFIPHAAYKIYLDCSDGVRANRIMKEDREGEKGTTVKDMIKKINQRENSERKRYKAFYGFDYHDKKNYDAVIDTTNLTIQQVVDEILARISPKHL